jgi:adenosylcobyric acid synthase
VLGTYVHGLFDYTQITVRIINNIRKLKGHSLIEVIEKDGNDYQELEFDRLANIVRKSIDMDSIYKIMKLEPIIKK